LRAVFLIDYFRREIVWSSSRLLDDLVSDQGQSKIDQPNIIVRIHHDILRLNIPVDDTLGMTVVYGLEQLPHILGSLLLSIVFLPANFLENRVARNILHHQVNELYVIVSLVVIHDVRVVQITQNFDLLDYRTNLVLQLFFIQHFDSHDHGCIFQCGGSEHRTEGPLTQSVGCTVLVDCAKLFDPLLVFARGSFDNHTVKLCSVDRYRSRRIFFNQTCFIWLLVLLHLGTTPHI